MAIRYKGRVDVTITDVKQQIQDRSLQDFYVFTGEEIEVQRIYINKIAEVSGKEVCRIESIADVWEDVINPSMFGEQYVYVVRDDKDLMQNEKLQQQISDGILGNNILILLLTSVDKRTKWYKEHNAEIVDFERLSASVLKKYIQREIKLNNANCERFIAICENDYSRILLEIAKIKQYKDWLVNIGYDGDADTFNELPACYDDSIFEYLVGDGTIFVPPKDAIFDLVDAILKRDVNRVYDMLYQSYAVGEANMVILSVLYTNAKQVLQVQSCHSSDISQSTGLTAWQVKCAKDKCGYYGIGELVDILRLIQTIQKGIILGEIDDAISVEYLLVNIL